MTSICTLFIIELVVPSRGQAENAAVYPYIGDSIFLKRDNWTNQKKI